MKFSLSLLICFLSVLVGCDNSNIYSLQTVVPQQDQQIPLEQLNQISQRSLSKSNLSHRPDEVVVDKDAEFVKMQDVLRQNEVLVEKEIKTAFSPFYIFSDKGSRQNHYTPSGFMPNGKCLSYDDAWMANCRVGKTCIRVIYDVECSRVDAKWGGIFWLNPPNNWGRRKGGYNLVGAKKLIFWARGEKGGEQIQEFTVGGIEGNYQDSDLAFIGPIILTDQWREYAIDLRGKDLSYISGGFAWTTSQDVNAEICTFYLDDIRFE